MSVHGPWLPSAKYCSERRVAWRHDAGQVLALAADRVARRAEIEQDRRAVMADEDIAGLDIAVQVAGGVDLGQTVEQRHEERAQFVLGELAALLAHDGGEAVALLVLHHHVGGAVRLEEAEHRHDARMAEYREGLRLLQEALEAPVVIVLVALGARPDRGLALADGELDRQVLLDRDVLLEVGVPGEIGDAEAARAQDRLDLVLVEPEAGRQGVCVFVRHVARVGGIGRCAARH